FWNNPRIIAANVEIFAFQCRECHPQQFDAYGQLLWRNSAIQSADRMLPTGTAMPGARGHRYYDNRSDSTLIHPGHAQGPFYMEPNDMTILFYECQAYY